MIDLDTILAVVADIFRVSLADLRGHRRFQRHMRARHAVAWLLVHVGGYGVTEAGELMDRHYTTVSASVAAADELIRSDPTYAAQLRACQAALTGEREPPTTVAETVARRQASWIVAPSLHVSMFWWGIAEPPAA